MGNEVFVVGAGFSKAIDSRMPTLAELGGEVAGDLYRSGAAVGLIGRQQESALAKGRVPTGNLETWLTSLADAQPYLDEPDIARQQALFLEVVKSITLSLDHRSDDPMQTAPGWLSRLIRLWHKRGVSVISLNYDTTVERAVWQADMLGSQGHLQDAILSYVPQLAQTGLFSLPTALHTFQLLKLHGSVDWYWAPGDTTGESVRRLGVTADAPMTTHNVPTLIGKERFIVPPLSGKSKYFTIPLVRELWRRAYLALTNASRVALIGYSLPVTDISVSAMLNRAVARRTRVEVVDTDAQPVAIRLKNIGLPVARKRMYGALPAFVDHYESEYVHELAGRWDAELGRADSLPHDAPVAVMLDRSTTVTVTAVENQGSSVLLHTTSIGQPREGDQLPSPYPTVREVLRLIRSKEQPVVMMQDAGSQDRHLILGCATGELVRNRAGAPEWAVFEAQRQPTIKGS